MIRLSSMKEQKKAEEAAGNQPKSKISAAQLRIAKVRQVNPIASISSE